MIVVDPWAIAADAIDPKPNPYLNDPVAWVRERTREHAWSKQRRIFESVRDHRQTAVPSSHGPGKSWCAARIATHWIDAHPPLEAFVVTTAPTDPQVKAILWREIQRAHRRGNLTGRITQDAQWKISDELVAFGRKPADIAADSDGDTITAFQGIHARFVLVIFDEAAGIPKPLWNAAHSLLTNADARFLAIGNPDDPNSEFAHICAGADPRAGGMSLRGWNVIPISLFDTPNFTGEDVPEELRPYLPSQAWLDSFVLNVGGPGTAIYTSKVDGLFPSDAKDGVVPWSWVARCRGDEATQRIGPLRVPVELGVDVGASDNGDLTVIRERQGMRAGRRWTEQSSDPEVVAAKVVQAAQESGAVRIKVDAIGVGWSLVALLRRDLPGVTVDAVVVSEEAPPGPDGEVYVNLRAALWWEVGRGLSHSRAWDLTEIDDRTIADLTEPRWWEDRAGRIQVEPKDQVRKRLGRSPDDADALLLAFYVPPLTNEARHVEATDHRLGGRRAR